VGPDALPQYARIPSAFEVRAVLRVDSTPAGLRLVEEKPDKPRIKDYDRVTGNEDGPLRWPGRFDVSNWGFFLVVAGEQPVVGAAVAFDTAGVDMLEARRDLAVLWDIRDSPEFRRSGVGTLLFRHAADLARARGCRQSKIETQNTNLPACRFYSRMSCVLGAVHRYAYAAWPSIAAEAMLLWYLDLQRRETS
jgi:ribosomal protein S18 acetylase RimI-like enzyme